MAVRLGRSARIDVYWWRVDSCRRGVCDIGTDAPGEGVVCGTPALGCGAVGFPSPAGGGWATLCQVCSRFFHFTIHFTTTPQYTSTRRPVSLWDGFTGREPKVHIPRSVPGSLGGDGYEGPVVEVWGVAYEIVERTDNVADDIRRVIVGLPDGGVETIGLEHLAGCIGCFHESVGV